MDDARARSRPCLRCRKDVFAPLDMCFSCGGPALYALPDGGTWAVETGPIASRRPREETLALLSDALVSFDRDRADRTLQSSRARIAGDLSERTAKALVARLDRKTTLAEAVQGPPKRLGAGGAMKQGLPLAGVAGGVGLAVALDLVVGLGVGTAVAVGLGVWNSRRRIPVIGQAPVRPALPYEIADAPGRFAAVLDVLPEGEVRSHVLRVGEAGFRIVAELSDAESLVSVGASGLEGGMGRSAMSLITEAVRVAESAARAPSAPDGDRLAKLRTLAAAADEALRALDGLRSRIAGQPDEGANVEDIRRETELVRRTVEEIGKP